MRIFYPVFRAENGVCRRGRGSRKIGIFRTVFLEENGVDREGSAELCPRVALQEEECGEVAVIDADLAFGGDGGFGVKRHAGAGEADSGEGGLVERLSFGFAAHRKDTLRVAARRERRTAQIARQAKCI